ncbi:hypothetical protein [Halobacterium noricense]|uniref:hypothetical protein n=1 Tax=Halobacterium noricense TaxID=223182 RepID=UPI001E378E4C|nr:hypothetical protein [Halobacterium noricense]UHH27162.1 hypothetical protein LT974_16040 [Halobacterium noricense]
MEELAERTEEVLREEVGEEAMIGVSYYNREGVGHVFRSNWAEQKYDPEQVDEIVEELRFEALGHVVHEEHQEEELRATVRVYQEMLDVAVPTNETHGVAFALDADENFNIREVIDTVEDALRETGPTTTQSND